MDFSQIFMIIFHLTQILHTHTITIQISMGDAISVNLVDGKTEQSSTHTPFDSHFHSICIWNSKESG